MMMIGGGGGGGRRHHHSNIMSISVSNATEALNMTKSFII